MYIFRMSSAATEKTKSNSYATALTKGMDSYIEPHRWSLNWAEDFERFNIRTSTWIVPGTEEEEG